MPTVEYEGSVHQFPDDFTDADIAKALKSTHETSGRPEALKTPTQHNDAMGGPPKGYVQPGAPLGTGFLMSGAEQIGRGVLRMTNAVPGTPADSPGGFYQNLKNTNWGEMAGGTSDAMRGAATVAGPFLLPSAAKAAVLAPAATALAFGGGALAQRGVEGGLTAAGVSPGWSQAAGDVAGVLGGAAAGYYGPKVINKLNPPTLYNRTLENANNPQAEGALQSLEGEVRMTPGQRSGQPALQVAERDLMNKPGTASEAQQFYAGAQDDLAAAGRRRINQQPGENTNPYGAGEGIQERLTQRGNDQKAYADKLYDSTRQTTARNTQDVQTGVKEIPASTILDSSGQPAIPSRKVPVMTTMETPVDLTPFKEKLAPIYGDLMRTLPEARRLNSPAFRALDEVMNTDKQQMNAMDFDKFLGAVKAITRDGTSDNLTTQSQGLAKQIVKAGEGEFQKALGDAGPNVLDKLQRARLAVRGYHDTFELLDQLQSEPAALYKNLTTGGDRVRNLLGDLKTKAPDALNTVGKTYLNEMLDKATREGGFGRSAGVKADWDRLGPETKKVLFSPKTASDIDDFLLAAKKLTPERGSPTADRISALHAYGDVGLAIAEFLGGAVVGQPAAGALVAGGTLVKTRVMPRILADLTFQPAGAQLLKRAITLPLHSKELPAVMSALNALVGTKAASSLDGPQQLQSPEDQK